LFGGNDKTRPLVVITATDEIHPGMPFAVICISTKGEKYPSVYNVPIPGGDRMMRIPHDSHAICEWKRYIKEKDISGFLGTMHAEYLADVIETRDDFEKLYGDVCGKPKP
jgi:mRNA-degrading endonuclease toxin of MazEF toxin-antitoxin module